MALGNGRRKAAVFSCAIGSMAVPLLYRVRYLDPLRRRWVRARYVCAAPEVQCRYAEYELIGEPELRRVRHDPLALNAAHLAPGAPRLERNDLGNLLRDVLTKRNGGTCVKPVKHPCQSFSKRT